MTSVKRIMVHKNRSVALERMNEKLQGRIGRLERQVDEAASRAKAQIRRNAVP